LEIRQIKLLSLAGGQQLFFYYSFLYRQVSRHCLDMVCRSRSPLGFHPTKAFDHVSNSMFIIVVHNRLYSRHLQYTSVFSSTLCFHVLIPIWCPVYFRGFFFQGALRRALRRGEVFVYGVGTTPGEGGDRGSGERNVKSKRRGNVMERSSPGARECHGLRNYVAKQLKQERWLRLGRNVKISRFSKILFSISVGAGSPFRPQISSSNIVLPVDYVYGIYASHSHRLISPSSPSFFDYPPYSRRHLNSFDVVATYFHGLVIALSPFRSQIEFFIPITFTSCRFVFVCKPCCLQPATASVFTW